MEHKNYILNKIIINSYDETSIIVMKMTILGGPRPPQAAEKMGYFCVLGGNLASVPPLVNYTFGTRGEHSLEIPLIYGRPLITVEKYKGISVL